MSDTATLLLTAGLCDGSCCGGPCCTDDGIRGAAAGVRVVAGVVTVRAAEVAEVAEVAEEILMVAVSTAGLCVA